MSIVRRLHYEGVIYRFKFLMLATLISAALTAIGFVMGQVRFILLLGFCLTKYQMKQNLFFLDCRGSMEMG